MRNVLVALLGLTLAVSLAAPVYAAKAATVGRVDGRSYIVRAGSSHWLACWSEMADGQSRLYVVDSNNGDARTVATEKLPGGICWIPGRDQLVWCQGVYVDVIKATRVYYWLYDVATKENVKLVEVTDFSDAYQADPIAADDGSTLFHITMDGNMQPSFNVYRPDSLTRSSSNSASGKGTMQLIRADAKIGAQYDLSSDGSRVYWILHDPSSHALNIACWNINSNKYDGLYEFNKKSDPADDHMFLKVDSTKHEAAAIVTSDKDPLLQMCVYMLDKLATIPVRLGQGEQVDFFDWKGRSGIVYALVSNPTAKQYSIEEIDPLTGKRTKLYSTSVPIYSTEYGSDGSYFFTLVDAKNAKRIVSEIVRVK
jgi:hypothetical protein